MLRPYNPRETRDGSGRSAGPTFFEQEHRMTESTSLPAARPRRILTQIAPVTWEHPADRAALQ